MEQRTRFRRRQCNLDSNSLATATNCKKRNSLCAHPIRMRILSYANLRLLKTMMRKATAYNLRKAQRCNSQVRGYDSNPRRRITLGDSKKSLGWMKHG